MTGNSARERELLEETFYPGFVLRDFGIYFAVRSLEVGIRDDSRSTVTWPGDIDHVQIVLIDDAIQMRIDEIQARCRAPMSEQTRLDVSEGERLFQQRIVVQINLSDREIVG